METIFSNEKTPELQHISLPFITEVTCTSHQAVFCAIQFAQLFPMFVCACTGYNVHNKCVHTTGATQHSRTHNTLIPTNWIDIKEIVEGPMFWTIKRLLWHLRSDGRRRWMTDSIEMAALKAILKKHVNGSSTIYRFPFKKSQNTLRFYSIPHELRWYFLT